MGLLRRLYWRSPLRTWRVMSRTHHDLTADDVMLASYPRSGVLWLRFLLLHLLRDEVTLEAVAHQLPYIGEHRLAARLLPRGGRLMKTHEPYRKSYRRAVHLVRDPRDIVLSYFSFVRRAGRLTVGPRDDVSVAFNRFLDAFVKGHVDPFGPWPEHLQSWLGEAQRGDADVLLVRYEDLRADPVGVLLRIAAWLGVAFDAGRAAGAVERSGLDRMRQSVMTELARRADSPFRARGEALPLINDGRVHGWLERLDDRQLARFRPMAECLTSLGYPAP